MRSMFSNRYDNSRKKFYERYEAARALHPSLPLYERPVEPKDIQVVDCSTQRRHRSYRDLANQTSEQLDNEAWLTSDRIPIVVRRQIEERTNKILMPRYDPSKAAHVFSHNGGQRRRGRRPGPETIAKLAAQFAEQVGGEPAHNDADEGDTGDGDVDVESTGTPSTVSAAVSSLSKPVLAPANWSSSSSTSSDESAEANPSLARLGYMNLQPRNKIPRGRKPGSGKGLKAFKSGADDDNKENIKPKEGVGAEGGEYSSEEDPEPGPMYSTGRIFVCPDVGCLQNFGMRRDLYKHQRDTGHHTWAHKCEKCGQIFRTAGFKRMHAKAACERNIQKQQMNTN